MPTLTLQDPAPDFCLLATDGKKYTLKDFAQAKVLVIFFTCNHCPYVKASDPFTKKVAEKFASQGVRFIAINSNDAESYPEDAFANMQKRMQEHAFPWVYLYDETQESAHQYDALKTPHFFLFDANRKLLYSGRGMDNPLQPAKSTSDDLTRSLEEHLAGKPLSITQTKALGCSIKWKASKETEVCDLPPKR